MSITTGFTAGTSILLFSGEVKNIEDITSDDIILSKDLDIDASEGSRGIVNHHTAASMTRLSLTNTQLTSDSSLSDTQDINLSSTQKVYVNGFGWKVVTDLIVGDVLKGATDDVSSYSSVVSIENISIDCDVIYLDSVSPNGNYIAGYILVSDETTNNL